MLRSQRGIRGMNALYRVDTFGVTHLLPEVQRMMKKPKSKEEYLRRLAILSINFPFKAIREINMIVEIDLILPFVDSIVWQDE